MISSFFLLHFYIIFLSHFSLIEKNFDTLFYYLQYASFHCLFPFCFIVHRPQVSVTRISFAYTHIIPQTLVPLPFSCLKADCRSFTVNDTICCNGNQTKQECFALFDSPLTYGTFRPIKTADARRYRQEER